MHGEVSAITYQQPTWLEEIRNEARHNPKLSSIKEVMQKGTHSAPGLVERPFSFAVKLSSQRGSDPRVS